MKRFMPGLWHKEKLMKYKILKITEEKLINLIQLKGEAEDEGFNFVGRMIYEFLSGKNSFSKEGEILYGAYARKCCLGICGLNADPYTDEPGIGRVRHLYVSEKFRNKGVGRKLVEKVIKKAKLNFKILRLKSTPRSDGFYKKLGFVETHGEHESHRMIFTEGKG